MPFAKNPTDGRRVYFEDDGGEGPAVVVHGGFGELVELVRAGPATIFLRIVAPLAKPAYATVGILSFLFIWGQLLWPVLVTSGPDFRPLPLGMSIFITQPPISWGDIMAFALMMVLPLMAIFILFQRWFIQSVASSGVKG